MDFKQFPPAHGKKRNSAKSRDAKTNRPNSAKRRSEVSRRQRSSDKRSGAMNRAHAEAGRSSRNAMALDVLGPANVFHIHARRFPT
jgi:hypothetical protein